MARTFQPELGQDLRQGFESLGSLFAPPTPQGLLAQSSIAKNQADLAARATANAHFASGTATIPDYAAAGVSDPVKGYIMGRLFDYSQAHPDAPLPTYDSGVYIMGGDVSKTSTGQQATPLNENQSRILSPGFARALGVPSYQHGVLDLGDNSKMLPGAGQQPIVTGPGGDDTPKFGEIGKNPDGTTVFGYAQKYDPQNPGPQPAVLPNAAGQSPIDPNLHGDRFLSSLDPQIANVVKSTAEGRMRLPTGMGANSPVAQRLRQQVMQYDPTFDMADADARFKTRGAFVPGAANGPGSAITAGNTAIGHLGDLSEAGERLGNFNTSVPGNNFLNLLRNGVSATSAAGTPVTDYNNILSKYVEEATKFYRGTGGTESDIQRDLANLSPNLSPAQLRSAIAKQVELMHGKIDALQAQWHAGMGPLAQDYPIVTPKSQAVIDRINQLAGVQGRTAVTPPQGSSIAAGPGGSSAAASAGAAGPSGAQAAPAPAQGAMQPPMAGARQAPDGQWYVPDPNRQGKYLRVEPVSAASSVGPTR